MTNITEADHDAVDWLYEMGAIAPHHLRLANEAFARHREQVERQSSDRIEALEAENERLREALGRIVENEDQYGMTWAAEVARTTLAKIKDATDAD